MTYCKIPLLAHMKIHSYTSGTQLFAVWITSIAFNHTFNFLKKNKLIVIGIENENQVT
jgi:hypothetical protein